MQPLTAPAAPAEDIEDVLDRFESWTNTHKAAHKTRDMIEGIREVSYEEALLSSRRRWQAHSPSLAGALPNESSAGRSLQGDTIAPDEVTLSTAGEVAASHSAAETEAHPHSFGSILAETVSPDVSSGPLALVWPAAGKAERQVSMSLRVAASEQALIKARAAEAGLSVSAYLRQCALEVERLRTQVHHTLTLIEQRAEQQPGRSSSSASPTQVDAGGFLRRLRHRFFGRPVQLTTRA